MKCTYHKLLEDIDHGNWHVRHEFKESPELIEFSNKALDAIKRDGNSAIAFWIGEEDFSEPRKIIPELCRLPFDLCWFEGKLGAKRIAFLCDNQPEGFGFLCFSDVFGMWLLLGAGQVRARASEKGLPSGLPEVSSFPETGRFDIFGMLICILCEFLSALNCVNVERVCHSVDPALQKRRNKRGRRPMFDFWTLAIDLHRGREEAGDRGGSHSSPRVHLRRGHARQHKPGEYTWVRPCVVGEKKEGMVHKEYAVRGVEAPESIAA